MAFDLECPLCGDVAYHCEEDFAYEDDGERCMSCGVPGHVNVSIDDDDGYATAYWWANEDSPEAIAYFKEEDEKQVP